MTLDEFVVKVKELASGMTPGEAKVIVEFPRKRTDRINVITQRTEREQV